MSNKQGYFDSEWDPGIVDDGGFFCHACLEDKPVLFSMANSITAIACLLFGLVLAGLTLALACGIALISE